MQELVLYHSPTCPFCIKVTHFMEKNNISLPLRDTGDFDTRQELINIGGKGQVPCLVIDGKALYESDDIINYLQKHRI